MSTLTKVKLTFEQLQEFYKFAYEDGRQAKLVCGGLSQLNSNSDISAPSAIALYRILTKDK